MQGDRCWQQPWRNSRNRRSHLTHSSQRIGRKLALEYHKAVQRATGKRVKGNEVKVHYPDSLISSCTSTSITIPNHYMPSSTFKVINPLHKYNVYSSGTIVASHKTSMATVSQYPSKISMLPLGHGNKISGFSNNFFLHQHAGGRHFFIIIFMTT